MIKNFALSKITPADKKKIFLSNLELADINTENLYYSINNTTSIILKFALLNLYKNYKVIKCSGDQNGFFCDSVGKDALSSSDLEQIFFEIKSIIMNKDISYLYGTIDEISNYLTIDTQIKRDNLSCVAVKINDMCTIVEPPLLLDIELLGHLKLTEVSGTKNDDIVISRIFGVAAESTSKLQEILTARKQNNHKSLGASLDLFHFQEESPGMVYWHPKGIILWDIIINFLKQVQKRYDYQAIKTPLLAKNTLWAKSGHLDKYLENIFFVHSGESDKSDYVLRPMNCPLHIQIFNHMNFTYKNLPVRFSEFGLVHRNESSGSVHGLFRLRSFTQDDAHIFCIFDQLIDQIKSLLREAFEVYSAFGFKDFNIVIATRPIYRMGSDEDWDRAENILKQAVSEAGVHYDIVEGEGAFYGPKIELHLKDFVNKTWQCGTIQLDFFMPDRLKCTYVNRQGKMINPILIHRAILGSIERYIGIILESKQGWLPIWLSPVQIVICSFTQKYSQYACEVSNILKSQEIRVITDISDCPLNKKIRTHMCNKIPLVGVVGEKEEQGKTITIREKNNKITTYQIATLINLIHTKVSEYY